MTRLLSGVPGDVTTWAHLHTLWRAGLDAPPWLGFPGTAELAPPDLLARLLAPITRAFGPAASARLLLGVDLVLSGLVAWAWSRGQSGWTRAAIVAVSTAGPAALHAWAGGHPSLGWAVLGAAAGRRWGALGAGAAAGLLAPIATPAALVAALATRRPWPIAGAILGIMLARGAALGSDTVLLPWVAGLGLGLGLLFPASRASALPGLAALALVVLRTPIAPNPMLCLVLMYSLVTVGAIPALQAWRPAVMVLLGSALIGEGARRSGAPPILDVTPPASLAALGPGPVLDLPASVPASYPSRYFQTLHGQPIAADPEGRVMGVVNDAVMSLMQGQCPDVRALGFQQVIARREEVFRELKPVVDCLGPPTADDGTVAVWRLTSGP